MQHNFTIDKVLKMKAQSPGLTERQLVEEKMPKGHSETVAVLAFAFAESGFAKFPERGHALGIHPCKSEVPQSSCTLR